MKNLLLAFIISAISVLLFACDSDGKEKIEVNEDLPKPKTLTDRFSYIVGNTMGENLKRDSVFPNYEYLILGIQRALEEKAPLMTRAEMDSTMNEMDEIFKKRQKRRQFRKQRSAEQNKKKAFEFLKKNKKKEGVRSLPSGIQYEILTKGEGETPKIEDHVKIHVIAETLDGKEFDNSYKRNQPVYAQIVKDLLKAWVDVLPRMKKGSKWRIYCPPNLVFGEKGTDDVEPNELVIFTLELLDFQSEPYEQSPKLPEIETRSDTISAGDL